MVSGKANQPLFHQIRDCSVMVLLMLYSVASLRIDSLHQFFHAENIVELHSAEQESNPCHKSIYHQQSEEGCAHQSHISQNDKCPLCEYKVTSDELLAAFHEEVLQLPSSIYFITYSGDFFPTLPFANGLRGPPSLI
jgi:hypothetical protein